jgi:hypothetical protein
MSQKRAINEKSPNQITLTGTFMTPFYEGRLVAGTGFEPMTSGL